MGDPAGVGVEIICRALGDLTPRERSEVMIFGTTSFLDRAPD
jgi:4-hydroxy-L-threonine phosphate dehydrogenase PdxA